MKILVTKKQFDLLKEYFDPIHFLKNKFGKESKSVKDPMWVPYEDKFQKIVDIIFKLTSKQNKLKHLKGYEVLKVTPTEKFTVLMRPIVDDWFNWKENFDYVNKLEKFNDEFKEVARMSGIDNPYDEKGLPKEVQFAFWMN